MFAQANKDRLHKEILKPSEKDKQKKVFPLRAYESRPFIGFRPRPRDQVSAVSEVEDSSRRTLYPPKGSLPLPNKSGELEYTGGYVNAGIADPGIRYAALSIYMPRTCNTGAM